MNQTQNLLRIVKLLSNQDERGYLGFCEFYSEVGFQAKRFYYITDVSIDSVRGKHAHRKLKQVYICLSGTFKLIVNDGETSESITLSAKSDGVYVKPGLWREMLDFSPGAICMVVASDEYNADDYIFDFLEFKRWANENN